MRAANETTPEATPTASDPAPTRKKRNAKWIYLLTGIAAAAVVFLIVVAIQPADFRIARSTVIAAPPSAVFEHVNDFHRWEAWNPWGKIDPAMKQSYEGEPAGVGAVYSWTGNSDVGEGRMTITDSQPAQVVRVKLEFLKPFAATNTAEFAFRPEGDQTAVTWSMTGKKNFAAKAIHLVVNMDKMIGDQFDKGLADMKAAVESDSR